MTLYFLEIQAVACTLLNYPGDLHVSNVKLPIILFYIWHKHSLNYTDPEFDIVASSLFSPSESYQLTPFVPQHHLRADFFVSLLAILPLFTF